MLGDPAGRVPTPKDVFDPGLDRLAVVHRMGVVHRDDIGRHRSADRVVVVGDDAHPRGALDQKARVAEKRDRDAALGTRAGEMEQPIPAGNDPGARRLHATRHQRCDQNRAERRPPRDHRQRAVYSTTSTRNGPGVAIPSAKRWLNASIVVTFAPGTPIERASPTQSRSGWPIDPSTIESQSCGIANGLWTIGEVVNRLRKSA